MTSENEEREWNPDMNENDIDTDFNLDDEYTPTPLVPNGTYHAAITDVKLDTEQQAIVFTYTFSDNGGIMTDGKTEIDGSTIYGRVWLPRPGDENELTKNGKQTKRQAKINMMADFAKRLGIQMAKPIEIITAIRNQDWVGLDVKIKVTASEYEGRVRNDIASVAAAT